MTASDSSTAATLLGGDFLRRLDRLDLVTKKILQGELRGERRSRRRGQGLEFSDHRDYGPGDDPRYIDWNVYMRLAELKVKQFHVEENLNLALFVDRSPSMDWGLHNKLLAAVKIAAALGYVGLSHFDRVYIHSTAPPAAGRGKIFSGKGSRLSFLEEAGSPQAAGGPVDLDPFVNELLSRFRGPSLAVILSDFYQAESLVPRLSPLASRNVDMVAIHLVDAFELNPPFSGPVVLDDAESPDQLSLNLTDDLLDRYRARFRRHLARVEHMLVERRIRVTRLGTETPFDAAVLKVLKRGDILRKNT